MRTSRNAVVTLFLVQAVAALSLWAGCSGANSSTSTSSSAPGLVTGQWPPGVRALIAQDGNTFSVFDSLGPLLTETIGETSATQGQGTQSLWPSFALSANRRFLASRMKGGDLKVWPIGRGQEPATYTAGPGIVDGISDDGRYVSVLQGRTATPKGPPIPTPLQLRIVDTAKGTQSEPSSIAGYLHRQSSPYALVASAWLPNGRYLISLASGGTRTYQYDPTTDALAPFPGIDEVWQVCPNGDVVGGVYDSHQTATAVVLHNGAQERVVPAAGWSVTRGAISPDGTVVVLFVHRETNYGWQSFRVSSPSGVSGQGRHWEAESPVSLQPSGASLVGGAAIGSTNRLAWGLRESDSHRNLVSFDMASGLWTDSLRPEDLRDGSVKLLGLIPD